jgi:hypothetical protein
MPPKLLKMFKKRHFLLSILPLLLTSKSHCS